MKATDNNSKNPLRCPLCDNYRYLEIKGVGFKDGTKKIGIKVPFLECESCKTSSPVALDSEYLHDQTFRVESFYKEIAKETIQTMSEGEIASLPTPYENKKFDKYDSLNFVYDSQDYYYIPGLYREWNEGSLCPVFFDKELLLYYNNHSDYRVIFSSYSRLHILKNDGESLMQHGFGINRNGKIICWLGDLHQVFSKEENERHRRIFYSFNVDSDHDIVSDYYFNQIEVEFMRSDNERQVFELRNDFDTALYKKRKLKLSNLNLDTLIEEYKHPIINEKDQINSAYIKLNSILTESLSVDDLKSEILATGITKKQIKGLGGLKLFEKFIIECLKIAEGNKIVSPLYVLYDLRVLAGHIKDSKYDEKLNSCKIRLELEDSATDFDIFDTLVESLIDMYKTLIEEINKSA